MKHRKFPESPPDLDQYSATSYITETTTHPSGDAEISLEQMGGIRREVDVKISR